MTAGANTRDRARHHRAGADTPTVWGRTITAILARMPDVGVDPDRMLRAIGLDRAALADVDARVPLDALYRMVELCEEWTGDELSLLHIGRDFDPASMDALGLLAVTSPTLGAALDATLRYQRVFVGGERYVGERVGDVVHVRYEPWGAPRRAHVTWADAFARDVGVNLPALVGALPDGVRVRLRRGPARDPARYVRMLGVVPELGAPIDEVILPASLLETPIPRADAVLAAFFERYMDERLARLPTNSPVSRASAIIEQLLPDGGIELSDVARRMRVSARTLQRRLADEQTSFAELVERTRRARALALVDAGAAIAEVAWMIGYSDPRAFHRAFRRWTGTTPAAWRARA